MNNIGDTGSSFDVAGDNSSPEPNPYDPDYSNSVMKPRNKSKLSFNNRSYIFTGSKNQLDILPVK